MKIKRLIVGELATNCYLLISGKEMAVIDPGGESNKILKEIENSKAKMKYIINTHNHFDHTSANEELSKETKAKILIDLKDGDEIKIGTRDLPSVLKVIHTPGHTKESICLKGKDFIFTGDTLFKDGHGRTDLAGGSAEEMEKSLKKLAKIIKPGMTVYPGHGEVVTKN